MGTNWIQQIFSFILLVLLQVWIFNKIHLFGVATPLFYIYFIIKLPTSINRNLVIFLSFLMGFFIDQFNYTLGINMLAATIVGFLRHYALNLFSPRDMVDSFLPSVKSLGFGLFMRYCGFIVLIHHLLFFGIESLSLFDPLSILLRTGASFILTMLMIFGTEGFNIEVSKK